MATKPAMKTAAKKAAPAAKKTAPAAKGKLPPALAAYMAKKGK
jgi:hypothetical protein